MTKVLSGLRGTKALIYLNDIVILRITPKEHNDRLIEVFDRLRLHSLKLQPDKCEFFLGKKYVVLVTKLLPRELDQMKEIQ
jgi:hypothetical protein